MHPAACLGIRGEPTASKIGVIPPGRSGIRKMENTLNIAIDRLRQFEPDLLSDLVAESEAAGLRFVRRLVDEWINGSNRFERRGETLYAARLSRRIIGIGGLNVDPYAREPGIGRIRHLYVLSNFRRQGTGRQLVEAVIRAARANFQLLRLRTESPTAGWYYQALGFQACAGVPNSTHLLELGQ